jgi:hypothetical protein
MLFVDLTGAPNKRLQPIAAKDAAPAEARR